jgi:NAD(P)H-dependent FMN reductase
MRIELISGSPRQNSITHRVAIALEKILKTKTDHEIGLINVKDIDLSPVQAVFTSLEDTPAQYKELAERIFNANAFILITPEYNASYSTALKNLLDHFPKQYHKVFGIVTASPGALGGIRAAMQLQQVIYGLFGIGSPHMLIVPMVDKKFSKEGEITDTSFQKNVDVFVNEFLWLAEKLVDEKMEVRD